MVARRGSGIGVTEAAAAPFVDASAGQRGDGPARAIAPTRCQIRHLLSPAAFEGADGLRQTIERYHGGRRCGMW